MHTVRKLFLVPLVFLTASSLQQRTVLFDEPIDALSVHMNDDTNVSVLIHNTWHAFVIEKEFDPTLQESDLVIFDTPVNSVTLKGDIEDITLHPIRVSTEPAKYELAATSFYRAPRILSRADWGADDSFLFSTPQTTRSDEPTEEPATEAPTYTTQGTRQTDCEQAQVHYPQDFKTIKTITTAANGQRYRWARRYSPEVKLLVVHHTAQKVSGDSRPAIERIRALYDYHANNRGWGDVGYHYFIDEQGGIYEGRSGGDKVVGGHVYCGNVGTVGIALLGNFELEQPPLAQTQSLQWLLDNLADKYDINLNKSVSFKGKAMDPIVRHKDLISTECPGYFLSNVITQIRSNIRAGNLLAGVTFPRVATKSVESRVESRLATRLAEAGQQLSRSYYRAKRLVRTAQRINPEESRLQAMKQQVSGVSNIQRLRAAREARLNARKTPVQTTRTVTTIATAQPVQTPNGHIRIRLSYTGNNAHITSSTVADVHGHRTKTIRLGVEGSTCIAVDGNDTFAEGTVRIDSQGGILAIESWNTNKNRFRGTIECRVINGELVLINELPLEQYIAGLAEEPDTEPYEKQKAFAVAARSYAAHYMEPENEKFPGMPYHGDDSPARFQMYGGVAFEEANPRWVRAAEATTNQVVMKDSDIIKTAYYSSNDGRTRSPEENGWQSFPHAEVFSSKPDPWCEGLELRGHGVGMSGCGAKGQALIGKQYSDILEYYYPGTSILQLQ